MSSTSAEAASASQRFRTSRAAPTAQDALLADYQLFHIEADLRWIDHTESRLSTLAEEVRDVPGAGRT